MVPVLLIHELAEELKSILSTFRMNSAEHEEVPISIFEYELPDSAEPDENGVKLPYVLVTPLQGEILKSTDGQLIKIQLHIGIRDEGEHSQGRKQVLNVIQDICERFQKNPAMSHCYAEEKMIWTLDIKSRHPSCYGMVELTFKLPIYGRENEFA